MGDLNILFVQKRLCGRAWKEAKVLTDAGLSVSLAELSRKSELYDYSIFDEHFTIPIAKELRSMLKGKRKIVHELRKITRGSDYDVIHSHNSPDNLGAWCVKYLDSPVVHDIHDLQSLLPVAFGNKIFIATVTQLYNHWEKYVCKNADGIVTVTPPMVNYIKEKYDSKNVEYLENKVIKGNYPKLPKLSEEDGEIHIVSAGRINVNEGYRKIMPILEEIAEQGVHVHLYPVIWSDNELRSVEEQCKKSRYLHCHKPVPQDKLITEVSQYDYGLIAFSYVTRNVKYGIQNKFFEYQVAGLPIIVTNDTYTKQKVIEKGCGIYVKNITELRKILEEKMDFNLDPSDCFMEPDTLLNMYNRVLNH